MTSKLKSIELQGYKTFAQKTRFEFPLPITAIVGPNGSGKSNIADAIRWVLGEQSYSLLRGRKTMDMIFTGSDHKAQAGMASVSILFDNSEEWLPIDYEEVGITRRAYRSGDNDYMINGQRVRLKDINELLGQSGLAERTYTIIGQGLIDNALSLKPDDRRKFFEEAAGIGLFRSRREEALNRLEITRRNLERVSDIIGELEPRLHSLQRQAKRAVEYEQVKNDLSVLLKDWYGYHWHKAQQSLIEAMQAAEGQEVKNAEVREVFQALEEETQSLQESARLKRIEIGELHKQLAQAHHQLEETNRETAILDERLSAANRQTEGFSEQIEIIESEITLLNERKNQLEKEATELETSAAAALVQKDVFEKELQERQIALTTMQERRSEQRALLTRAETVLIRLKAAHDEMRNRSEEIASSTNGLKQTLGSAENGLSGYREKQENLQKELHKLEAELTEFEQQNSALQQEISGLGKQREERQQELNQIQADFSRCKARLEVLETAEKNLTGVNQGAQYLLKNAARLGNNTKMQSAGGCFLFPQEYEVAAAAVLGDALDGILLDRPAWPKAVQLLNEGDHGRAVLITGQLSTDKASVGQPKREFAGLKTLLEIAQFEAEYRALAERLFRSAYLADSIGQALELQPLLPADGCLVTMTGELFRADGSLVAGREHKHQLLSRKREMKELKQETDRYSEKRTTLQNALSALEQTLAGKQKQAELNTGLRRQRNSQLEQMRRNLNQATMDTQKCEQLIHFQNQRIAENDKIVAEITLKLDADAQEMKDQEQALTGYQDALKTLSEEIRQIQLDDLQREVHHWTLEWTLTENSRKESLTRIAETEIQVSRNRERLEQNRERTRKFQLEIEAIAQQKQTLRDQAQLATRSVEMLEAKIMPEAEALKIFESKLETLQQSYQNQQQKISTADRLALQTQMEVSRQQYQLETLRQRIEDDFGLVAFDYREKVTGQTPLPLGEMVAKLPVLKELPENLKDQISRQKSLIHRIGAINPDAIEEYKNVSERYSFLKTQMDDLKKADRDLREVIGELDEMMQNAFQVTFEKVQGEFSHMFNRLFGGGSAKLLLTDPNNVNQSGIDIEARLPGRRAQELSLLSGGERSLTSVALVFSLLRVSPTPFCVLDEVDAALDEANVSRFCELLKELSQEIQFIVITHNRNTVETADVIYGITMSKESASQMVSLRLDEVKNKDYLV